MTVSIQYAANQFEKRPPVYHIVKDERLLWCGHGYTGTEYMVSPFMWETRELCWHCERAFRALRAAREATA